MACLYKHKRKRTKSIKEENQPNNEARGRKRKAGNRCGMF